MAVLALRPAGTQFLSILQLVSSSNPPRQTDFESMEDVKDLARFTASTDSISDTGHSSTSVASTNCSFNSPLLRTTSSFHSTAEFHSRAHFSKYHKGKGPSWRSFSHSVDHNSPIDISTTISSPTLPSRSRSFNGPTHRMPQEQPAKESVPAPSTPRSAPILSASTARHSLYDSHTWRQDLEMESAGTHRLQRSSSTRVSRGIDKSTIIGSTDARDRYFDNLWAEPQLSEEQKLVALKRARKIAQVFGKEAPTALVRGIDYPSRPSAEYRDSLSTVSSADIHSNVRAPTAITRRRSNSACLMTEIKQGSAVLTIPVDQTIAPTTTPETITAESGETSPPGSPTTEHTSMTFRERRRRATKLTQFFGVNFQDIPRSDGQAYFLPSKTADKVKTKLDAPVVAVDVKVTRQRLWGLVDGEMESADVSDVIDKLRVLKAA